MKMILFTLCVAFVTACTSHPDGPDSPDAYEGEWAHAGDVDGGEDVDAGSCVAGFWIDRDAGTWGCTCLNTGMLCPADCRPSRFPYQCWTCGQETWTVLGNGPAVCTCEDNSPCPARG